MSLLLYALAIGWLVLTTVAGVQDGEVSPELLAGLIALLVPPVVQLVKRPGMPASAGQLIAVTVCILVGTLSAWIGGEIDLSGPSVNGDVLLQSAITAFVSSQLVYDRFFKGTSTGGLLAEKLLQIGAGDAGLPDPDDILDPPPPA